MKYYAFGGEGRKKGVKKAMATIGRSHHEEHGIDIQCDVRTPPSGKDRGGVSESPRHYPIKGNLEGKKDGFA